MGTIFQHFLCFREDYVRLLKGFLRELVRQVRSEKFPFTVFCRALVQQRSDPEFVGLGQLHKVRSLYEYYNFKFMIGLCSLFSG